MLYRRDPLGGCKVSVVFVKYKERNKAIKIKQLNLIICRHGFTRARRGDSMVVSGGKGRRTEKDNRNQPDNSAFSWRLWQLLQLSGPL